MSNIGSTALSSSKQHSESGPHVPAPGVRQQAFNAGTRQMLDEARGVVENAVGQGQEINPLVYQMLGLRPTYTDNSADLQAAQGELDGAQKQYDEAAKTMNTLRAIPGGKRSPEQRKQLAQLKKGMPALVKTIQSARESFGQLQTSQKQITGLERMDPNEIPAESPFSSQNALNKAQASEADRLNQYLAGGEVDPTLKHQYDAAEQSLRAKLSQRFGPDYENSSVGQMALQNFSRQKNEAFATWNQQQVENYNNLAFSGQANLQSLLAQRIGMLQEPAQNAANMGNALGNTAQQRLQQQSIENQRDLGRAGVSVNTSNYTPLGSIAGGVGNLLTTPYNKAGDTLASKGVNALTNWASGAGAANAYDAGIASGAAGVGAGEAVGGASLAGGGEASMAALV